MVVRGWSGHGWLVVGTRSLEVKDGQDLVSDVLRRDTEMDWLLLVGAGQGKDLGPKAAEDGEAEPEEEGPAFTKEVSEALQGEINWYLVKEVRAGPLFEEVEVRYLVL